MLTPLIPLTVEQLATAVGETDLVKYKAWLDKMVKWGSVIITDGVIECRKFTIYQDQSASDVQRSAYRDRTYRDKTLLPWQAALKGLAKKRRKNRTQ